MRGLAAVACVVPWLVGPVVAQTGSAERMRGDSLTRSPAPAPTAARALAAPTQAATAPRRILLVDDDWSHNNASRGADRRLSASDTIYRRLVAQAVGGDANAWEVEVVPTYSAGPAFERLQPFDLVVWYTGGSYGGNPDNSAVLSLEDEKTVRRYLQETGGSFVLVSPGYPSNFRYGSTWERSTHAFTKEVLGVAGFAPLLQRFKGGMVDAADGRTFTVGSPGAAEAQFSAVNAESATPVFTSTLNPTGKAAERVPVAVANAHGSGRIVYVGFTLENVAEPELAPAFAQVLGAAGRSVATPAGDAPAAASPGASGVPARVADSQTARLRPPPAAPAGPPPTNLQVVRHSPGSHPVRWLLEVMPPDTTFEVQRRTANGWVMLAQGVRTLEYTDVALLPAATAYKVVAVYADGRRGEATIEYPNPPQPTPLTGLGFTQTGPGTVEVRWNARNTSQVQRVYATGLPPGGRDSTTGSITLTDLPVGVHEVRVAEAWGSVVSPVPSSIRVLVNPDRGRYRVLFTGLQVIRQADDDLLDLDGRGNEAFAAALWVTTDPRAPQPATVGGFARSKVYGDVRNFADRVQAGSASPQGGLRTGDVVPAQATQARPGIAPSRDQFPLVLWEGELIQGGPLVGVLPIVFERNANDHTAWNRWADAWVPNQRRLQELGAAMRWFVRDPIAPRALHGFWNQSEVGLQRGEWIGDRPNVTQFDVRAGADRPIGLRFNGPRLTGTVPDAHPQTGFVLDYRRVEAALGRQATAMLDVSWPDEVSGHYVGHFQLERLSPPPPEMPPVAGTVLTTTTPTSVYTPAPAPAPAPTTSGPLPAPSPERPQSLQAPQPGPAPANVVVQSRHPGAHEIRWFANGAVHVNVFRQVGDRLVLVKEKATQSPALDRAVIAPGTVYEVIGVHADGREGRTRVTVPNPPQPARLSGLQATQSGSGTVTLRWTIGDRNGDPTVRVTGPTLSESNVEYASDGAGAVVKGLPEGDHEFRAALHYDDAEAPGPVGTLISVKRWRETSYRLVLLGFRVDGRTKDDDALDFDGRGDEVFFGAMAFAGAGAATEPSPPVRSRVFGDDGAFRDRVRVGQAGPTGGIRSGDVIPSEAALQAQPNLGVYPDRLPLQLWAGPLPPDARVVVPVAAFEWDNGRNQAFDGWRDLLRSERGRADLHTWATRIVVARPNQVAFEPLATDRSLWVNTGTESTRPIGAGKDGSLWKYRPEGFVLTLKQVEAMLGAGSTALITAPLGAPGEGDYRIVVQLERFPGGPLP